MFILMISSRLGELLCHYRVYSSFPHLSLFIFYVLEHRYSRYPLWIARQSLPTSPMFQSDPKRNQSKVSGPELNHDYISYSDIKIRYRWNRGSGPLISLDHVRIRRPIESSCSWMLHRNPSLFLSSTEKGSFRVTRAFFFWIDFSFRYGNAMQEVSEIRLFLMMKTRYLKVGNVRRRLSVSDGK